jgi:hypothetical protein
VKQIFEVKDGKKNILVGGCRCTKGALQRKEKYRVVRHGDVVHEGMTMFISIFYYRFLWTDKSFYAHDCFILEY